MRIRVIDVMVSILETGECNLDFLPPIYVETETEPPIYKLHETPIYQLAERVIAAVKLNGIADNTLHHYVKSGYLPVIREYCRQFGREISVDNLLALQMQLADMCTAGKISKRLFDMKKRVIDLMIGILNPADKAFRSFPFLLWQRVEGTPIRQLAETAIEALKREGCTNDTVQKYLTTGFMPLAGAYCQQFGDTPSTDSLLALRKQIADAWLSGEISSNARMYRIRAVNIMISILETGDFKWQRFPSPLRQEMVLSPIYKPIFEAFVASCHHLRSPDKEIGIAKRFFFHLETEFHCPAVADLNFDHCVSFAEAESEHREHISDVVYALHKLFRFLNESGTCSDKTWKLFIKSSPEHKKVLSPMPYEDIIAMIQSQNQDTVGDKRNTAVITLMAATALRCCDLAGLRRQDIDWRKNELIILQRKTGNYITIAVEHKFLEPLADYLLNYRPDSHDDHVFLSLRSPYRPLSAQAIGGIVYSAQRRANISHVKGDGKTAHGIRRALGTEMIAHGVDLHTVGQALGHVNTESASSYISMDLERLKVCALPMSSLKRYTEGKNEKC